MTKSPPQPKTDVCLLCDADIEWYPGIGWVDTLSGDDGGTYDWCAGQEGVDMPHIPAKSKTATTTVDPYEVGTT